MKTRDLRNDSGQLTGFSISRLFVGRHSVPKIVAEMPGAKIVRKQKRFRFAGPDDFCEFVVDETTFLAIEPFGDNSEFWIVVADGTESPALSKVRVAFASHRVLFGAYDG